jgi:hypothetical protein
MQIARTEEEINDMLNSIDELGPSVFSGQTYEQGVVAGIQWVLGETDDHPYPLDEVAAMKGEDTDTDPDGNAPGETVENNGTNDEDDPE